MSSDAQPELAPIAFLTAFSLLLPLPWHWRNGNVATLSMIAWLFALNIIYGIDAVLWADDAINRAAVWCDISTKIIIGGTTALPLAGLCVCIRLYKASAARGKPSDTPPRYLRLYETLACYCIPILFMSLHYIVQGHRFNILETFGCRPTAYFSILGLLLVWFPPLIISLIALVFAVIALVNLTRHYRSFVTNMRDADVTNFQLSHYIRLMVMALTQILWVTAITAFSLAFNFKTGVLSPYISWASVHARFSAAWSLPRMLIRVDIYWGLYANWYCVPVSTWIFVALFAFGEDAVVEYRRCLFWVYQRCGIAWMVRRYIPKRLRNRSSQRLSGILPSLRFNRPKTTQNTFSVNIQTNIISSYNTAQGSEEDLSAELGDKAAQKKEIC